jgi:hypothetical protein
LKAYGLHSAMDQFAAERNAQELSIRYELGPRNQWPLSEDRVSGFPAGYE